MYSDEFFSLAILVNVYHIFYALDEISCLNFDLFLMTKYY